MEVKRYTLNRSAPARPAPLWDDLDEEQRAVVEAPPGYILAVAGAGSGKTRALTYRVANLIMRGAPPERILLCTFTSRAAREMLSRVETLTGLQAERLLAGTFHHVANRLLRLYADRIGLGPDYSILDRGDSADLLGRIIGERPAAARSRRFPQAALASAMISEAVNQGRTLEEVVQRDHARFAHCLEELRAVADAYASRKRKLGLLDFDDLLLGWQALLTDHPSIAGELQDRFLHVLVDEYQDVNCLQAGITDSMALGHSSLTVVGDDDQSIYAFRGATVDAMLQFPERHPGASVFRLQTSYRCTPEILRLANASIAQNLRRHPKTLRSARGPGALPVLVSLQDPFQQAAFVAQRVLELHEEEQIPLSAMGVLFRAHSHSLELQVELTRRQIPYSVRAGLRFFEQAHIKDALAHLRWLVNPRDELAGLRVLRLQRGIGAAIAGRVLEHLELMTFRSLPEGLASCLSASGVTGLARKRLKELGPHFSTLEQCPGPAAALRTVARGPYRDLALAQWPNAETRLEDLERLADYSEAWQDVSEFLQELSIMGDFAAEGVRRGEAPEDQLTLSTVHQAKGLEWRAVFLLWLAEGHFPSALALRDPDGEEEERRLFHVALTRAKDLLTLCHPILSVEGDRGSILLRPSRFLAELPDLTLLERWQVEEAFEGQGT
ncbi:MAG: ATP-dependent helicase [Polyangia bacterium]|jgi:DNA helicase-2/ATP-dependent DNA helicase PcrA|nr:ATP-dependent helicase [Polyangia bacterium]